jgi:hypothetical protein
MLLTVLLALAAKGAVADAAAAGNRRLLVRMHGRRAPAGAAVLQAGWQARRRARACRPCLHAKQATPKRRGGRARMPCRSCLHALHAIVLPCTNKGIRVGMYSLVVHARQHQSYSPARRHL